MGGGTASNPREDTMSETNHGRLDDGTVWARFCSNPDCHILGCPGDCTPTPAEVPPVTFAELHREIAARDQEIQRLRKAIADTRTYIQAQPYSEYPLRTSTLYELLTGLADVPAGQPGRSIGNFR